MVSSVNLFIAACREESKRLATIEAQGKEVGLLPPLSRRYHPWVVLNATGAPLTCAVLRDDQVTVRPPHSRGPFAHCLQQAPRLLRVQERGALSSVEQEVYTRSQIGDVVCVLRFIAQSDQCLIRVRTERQRSGGALGGSEAAHQRRDRLSAPRSVLPPPRPPAHGARVHL